MTDSRTLPDHVPFAVVAIFAVVILGSLARLQTPAGQETAASVAASTPSDSSATLVAVLLLLVVLVATATVIAAIRFGLSAALLAYLVVVVGYAAGVLLADVLPAATPTAVPAAAGVGASALYLWHREWWVVTGAALLIGILAVSAYGPAFSPAAIVIALVLLAAYDHIAVEVTGHMETLGDSMIELLAPMFVIVPFHRAASVRDGAPKDADVLFLGLGDVAFPALLVVSAAVHFATSLPAAGAAGGALLGAWYLAISTTVGESAAGLPALTAGTIAGLALGGVGEYVIVAVVGVGL